MKPRTAKAKGRRLQNWIRDFIMDTFSGVLRDGDVKPAIMGEGGEDIKLSPAALDVFPYSIEAKNVEKLNVWAAYQQAVDHNAAGEPLLIMKKNNNRPLAVVDAEHFLNLVRRANVK